MTAPLPARAPLRLNLAVGALGLLLLALFGGKLSADDLILTRAARTMRSLTQRRQHTELLTSARRETRRAQVAMLERWLPFAAPKPAAGGALLRSGATVLGQVRGLAGEALLSPEEKATLRALIDALERFDASVGQIIRGEQPEPQPLGLAQEMAAIDLACTELLRLGAELSAADDAQLDVLRSWHEWVQSGFALLLLAFSAGAARVITRRTAARRTASAERARREQEALKRELEERFAERTRELAAANDGLRSGLHWLREAQNDLVRSEARLRSIFEGAREGIAQLDDQGRLLNWNHAAEQVFGWAGQRVAGQSFVELALPDGRRADFLAWQSRAVASDAACAGEAWREETFRAFDGRVFPAECSVASCDRRLNVETTLFVRDLSVAKALEAELRQAQKLESVGRLASGIAHEINTPLQFVTDSCHFLREAFGDLGGLLAQSRALAALPEGDAASAGLRVALAAAEEEIDLPYLREAVPGAIDRALEGLQRVTTIVRAMKTFAHPDRGELAPVDLNKAVESTLIIARNEYKYVAELETHFGPLPPVLCHSGEICQAVLNIVINAAHAIADVVRGTDRKGRITVSTSAEGGSVLIAIADTGGGIPENVRERIYDPFFTTKEVGKGTGQGLGIARSVVREKHGGELWFETAMGKGTTFFIKLPWAGAAQPPARKVA